MILRDILREVGVMVPNDIPPDILVSWINQVQSSLYRDYPLPDAVYAFAVNVGVQFYNPPVNCPEDRIEKLVINDMEILFLPNNSDVRVDDGTAFWTMIAGQIFISPEPESTKAATLYYRPKPADLTMANLNVVPEFPIDFHELLVLGCAAKAASLNPSMAGLHSILQGQYLALKERADLLLTRKKQKKVMIHRSWE